MKSSCLCALGILISVSVMGCAADPREIVIAEENQESLLEAVGNETGLTVEEVGLLTSFELRRGIADAFDVEAEPIVGRTIGEIIELERDFQAEEEARRVEEERLAEEARAREEALAAELREAILLTVYEKSFVPSNISAGRYEDHITFRTTYRNTSGKEIRAFRGSVRFTDLFGEEISNLRITIQEPIAAGAEADWNGAIEYNQFIDNHEKLRNTELENMRVQWVPRSIIFADGSQIGEQTEEP